MLYYGLKLWGCGVFLFAFHLRQNILDCYIQNVAYGKLINLVDSVLFTDFPFLNMIFLQKFPENFCLFLSERMIQAFKEGGF